MRLAFLALLILGACTPAAIGTAYQIGCAGAPVLIEADPLPNDDRGEDFYRWACLEPDE